MTWYRTDKETGTIEPVTERRVRNVLEGYYEKPRLAISEYRAKGLPVQSPFAVYAWKV